MKKRLIILTCLACMGSAHAQQFYKCHMPDGKLYFSDKLCGDINKIETVRDKTPVTAQQRREAQQVAARRNRELGAIEDEKAALAAERAAEVRQIEASQAAAMHEKRIDDLKKSKLSEGNKQRLINEAFANSPQANTVEGRAKRTEELEKTNLSPGTKAQLINDVNTPPSAEVRAERRALREEQGRAAFNEQQRPMAQQDQAQRQKAEQQRMRPTSFKADADGRGGWDNLGNRYTTTANGALSRNDGELCRRQEAGGIACP